MKKFLKDCAVYILVVACILIVLISIQPAMVRTLPNDFSRHRVIIEALHDNGHQPDIIFFGNSLSMFGIDAKTIGKNLPGSPVVYNLSSVGQSIFEGAYFVSSVPEKTKQVFQCVDYSIFTESKNGLQDAKAMSMILNGYHIDSSTRMILNKTHPYFDQNKWLVAYEARGNLRSSVHNYLRKYLDYEKFDTNFHDRYFPHIYLDERHPRYPNISDNKNYDSLPISDTLVSLANRIKASLEKRNIQYHIILMPVNPEIYPLNDSLCAVYLNDLKSRLPGIDIIDLSRALKPEFFYDAIHANKKGAESLSVMIANRIMDEAEKSGDTSNGEGK